MNVAELKAFKAVHRLGVRDLARDHLFRSEKAVRHLLRKDPGFQFDMRPVTSLGPLVGGDKMARFNYLDAASRRNQHHRYDEVDRQIAKAIEAGYTQLEESLRRARADM